MKWNGFVGSSYKMDSLPISAQVCINWYPETETNEDAATRRSLQPTPGYLEAVEVTDPSLPSGSYTRAMYRTSRGLGLLPESGGSIIQVVGNIVYWFKPATLTYEALGTITNTVSKISMVDDGFGLIIVDGVKIYRLDLKTKAFTTVSFNLTNPTSVAFMGGYTLVIGEDENLPQNTFFFSGLYDNSSWSALDYYSAEQSQDPITAMIVSGTYVYVFGPNSYELWTTTDDQDSPFKRAYASSGAIGIHAPLSLTKQGNKILMIGTSNQGNAAAFQSNGTDMVKVSTVALEKEWSKFDVSDCTSWAESTEGHDFVHFNFDAMDKTYTYGVNQGDWHERASRDEILDTLHRWEPNYGIQFNGITYVGDRNSTKVFTMGPQYATENGRNIIRERVPSHQNAEQKVVRYDAVRFDMVTGNGITNEEPGRYTEAPIVMFGYSHDQGRTWSSEIRRPFGATGQYETAVEFKRLGSARNLTVRFRISDPCRTAILNGWVYPIVAQRGRRG